MTQSEKLQALIERAIEGGYDSKELTTGSRQDKGRYLIKMTKPSQIRGLLFDPTLAKALWGDDCIYCEADQDLHDHFHSLAWRYQLQQAVISKDPIDYLYGAVFGEKE